MILFAILIIVLISVLTVVFVIVSHIKKTERQKYYAAAGNILREEFLNYALQNTISPECDVYEPKSGKTMLYLKSKSSGRKSQFVFDPEKIVKIGRDNDESNIFINDMSISQNHCQIYSADDRVYLQDLNSSNGTFVQRGLFKKYVVSEGCHIELKTDDKIIVGNCVFKVCLFYYDLAVM